MKHRAPFIQHKDRPPAALPVLRHHTVQGGYREFGVRSKRKGEAPLLLGVGEVGGDAVRADGYDLCPG